MTTSLEDVRHWVEAGTARLLAVADTADLEAPSALPGWNRRYVVAHVAANADALRNLARWARTGEERPMYASPEERAAGIERGARLPPAELLAWLRSSADTLASDWDALTDKQWARLVRTAQGRMVPAVETPWMRAREVYVHAVDLDAGITFAQLPDDFLAALVNDISAKRGLAILPEADMPEVAAWLAGRPHGLTDAPELAPWL